MKEPIPDGPAAGHFISDDMLNTMLDEYYASRGWDETGKPTPETLDRLQLAGVVA